MTQPVVGVVAAGESGPLWMGYGELRNHVLGLTLVTGDGRTLELGGRVVKNVAGYDLCKLFTGSFGTLGIIAELNFKLRPVPECESTVVVTGVLHDLPARASEIISAGLFPVAAEILSPAFAATLGITTNQPVMLVRFAGNQVGVKYQIERTLALSDGGEQRSGMLLLPAVQKVRPPPSSSGSSAQPNGKAQMQDFRAATAGSTAHGGGGGAGKVQMQDFHFTMKAATHPPDAGAGKAVAQDIVTGPAKSDLGIWKENFGRTRNTAPKTGDLAVKGAKIIFAPHYNYISKEYLPPNSDLFTSSAASVVLFGIIMVFIVLYLRFVARTQVQR